MWQFLFLHPGNILPAKREVIRQPAIGINPRKYFKLPCSLERGCQLKH